MDKIKINNQIVSMRKYVKQGKIYFINRYVKEHMLLQNRKGEENQVSKCKRKAERLLLEIEVLKKIKPDSVSKMALSKAKDWKAVLNQKNIPLEDRCFANLANFKPVQAEVEKFHSANSYLVPKISTLLQEWEEKAKFTPQSSQKNEKPFRINKAHEKPGKEGDVFKIKVKPESYQIKKKQPIVEKPLKSENNEFSDENNYVSDLSFDDADKTIEENEHHSDEDKLNVINSQKKLLKSENGRENIDYNLSSCKTDPSPSEFDEDESVSQESEDESDSQESENESISQESEDESVSRESEDQISSKSSEMINDTIASQKPELKVNSVKNIPKLSKIPLETNKITDKQSTLKINSSPKPNSTKAVALLNLNEMLDMDEIPIDNNRTVVEAVEKTAKRKRDTFFLSGDRDDFSEGGDEDSDNGRQNTNLSPLRKKPRNAFNKKDSFNKVGFQRENDFKNRRNFGNSPHNDFKNGRNFGNSPQNDFKNRKNFGNSPHSQKFGFGEKKFHKTNKEFNSNKQSNKFEMNQGRGENNFNKGRFNNFEKKDKRQENQFNKKWNPKDANNRTEEKPFKTTGKFLEKNKSFNRNDNLSHKRDSFNQPGKKDEPPLHPSWEAKKKLKTNVNAKFQGKKVVFDD